MNGTHPATMLYYSFTVNREVAAELERQHWAAICAEPRAPLTPAHPMAMAGELLCRVSQSEDELRRRVYRSLLERDDHAGDPDSETVWSREHVAAHLDEFGWNLPGQEGSYEEGTYMALIARKWPELARAGELDQARRLAAQAWERSQRETWRRERPARPWGKAA